MLWQTLHQKITPVAFGNFDYQLSPTPTESLSSSRASLGAGKKQQNTIVK